jgi:hypothetical protein
MAQISLGEGGRSPADCSCSRDGRASIRGRAPIIVAHQLTDDQTGRNRELARVFCRTLAPRAPASYRTITSRRLRGLLTPTWPAPCRLSGPEYRRRAVALVSEKQPTLKAQSHSGEIGWVLLLIVIGLVDAVYSPDTQRDMIYRLLHRYGPNQSIGCTSRD